MRIILLTAALIVGCHEAAFAEPPPASSPLAITVRPSRVEDQADDAREREDRLYRRMQQNEFQFRNICTGCGGGMAQTGGSVPFNPIETLANRSAPARAHLKPAVEAP